MPVNLVYRSGKHRIINGAASDQLVIFLITAPTVIDLRGRPGVVEQSSGPCELSANYIVQHSRKMPRSRIEPLSKNCFLVFRHISQTSCGKSARRTCPRLHRRAHFLLPH